FTSSFLMYSMNDHNDTIISS
uniref:Uncharacterized protein n=1 Tax=Amphimedon queenslandica TaxID=400682 RepID=A0A1X7U6S6_AMPQE